MSRLAFVAVALLALPAGALTWTESSRSDFVDGIVDAQMYVSHRAQLDPDTGCIEFYARFDVDNNGYYDLACSDDSGPHLTLYMGDATGYSPDRRLQYDVSSGGNVDLADLDLDGHTELVHSGWRSGAAVIYRGTPSGPSATDTTELAYGGQAEDVNVFDLDRDGYLDIIVGSSDGNLYFFWGTAAGYSTANRTSVNLGYAVGHNTEIADFDKDGWGDIAVSLWTFNECPIVYWGPGRRPRSIVNLPFRWNNGHGITVVDVNADEWLDIVYTGYDTVITSRVYFGSDTGFGLSSYLDIHPGRCYGGSAAADWNHDGWPDLVFLCGNWTQGGRWRPAVYLNSGVEPYFSDSGFVELGTDTLNASGGFIADFNFDGAIDIFVNNMLPDDSSYVIWGPDSTRRTGLPVNNDHHGVFREPGSSYNRAQTAQYYSSVFDAGPDSVVLGGSSSWQAFEPPGAGIAVAFRGGDGPSPDSTWTSFAPVMPGSPFPGQMLGHRYLQYRVRFNYTRPCYLPMLEAITTTVTCTPPAYADVALERLLAPADTVDSGAVVTPAALVRNLGNQPATFPVHLLVGSGYAESATVAGLVPGATDTVRFPPWTADSVTTHSIVGFAALVGDQDRSNDTARGSVTVRMPRHPDVGPTAVIAPTDTVDSGATITPRVTVRNFGNTAAAFPVHLLIGTDYADSATVSLAAGASAGQDFAPWTARVVGPVPTVCRTALAGDQNPANDTIRGSVTVAPLLRRDVGPVTIVAPAGTIDSGSVVAPRAVVVNYGSGLETFPVHLSISSGYRDSQLVSLPAGSSDTVRFSAWYASGTGPAWLLCRTALPADERPENDTCRGFVDVVAVHHPDVAPMAILAPLGTLDSGTLVQPRVLVANLGDVTVDAPVLLAIGSDYRDSTLVRLDPARTDTVGFADWTADPVGSLPIACRTALAGDENPANDTLRDSVAVRHRPTTDVGPVAILAPLGTLDSGAAVTPRAVVRNHGTQSAFFAVRMLVGTGYDDRVQLGLNPGQSDTVAFAPWTAAAIGTQPTVCRTELAADENPANDTLRDSVIVAPPPVHDVGTLAILAPLAGTATGDTVLPRALVTNHGTATERYFGQRFRIGVVYDVRSTFIGTLLPGAQAEVVLPAWTASTGDFAITCSTELYGDADRTNDRARSSIHVAPKPTLAVESDILDRIEAGARRSYWFVARLGGERAEAVSVAPVSVPSGWDAWLVDSVGEPLTGSLGVLAPGIGRRFGLRVNAPGAGLAGLVDSLPSVAFTLFGRLDADALTGDSAQLVLVLVPNLEIHNYPNPVKDRTRFIIGLPEPGRVSLTLYNRAGERVRRLLTGADLPAGVQYLDWDAGNDRGRRVARGTYECVLEFTRNERTDRVIRKVLVTRE
jgi:hypothetical protein